MNVRSIAALPLLISLGGASSAWAAEGAAAIRLPAIITRWTTPGEDSMPEISADEVGRCMGADATVRGKIAEFDARRAELDARSNVLLAKAAELAASSRVIEAEQSRLNAVVGEHRELTASLDERRSRMEDQRAAAGNSPGEVRQFNELVRAFNADISRANALRARLVGDAAALTTRIDAHNELVRASRAEFETFESEGEAFLAMARRFMTDSGGYFGKCAGTRRLKRLTPE